MPRSSVATPMPSPGQPCLEKVALSDILTDRNQIRRPPSSASLEALSRSIMHHGILEPLIARRTDAGLELVCGHRRHGAARLAGLTEVPVLIQDIADRDVILVALHENIHSDGMSPIEEAEVYRRLLTSGECPNQGVLALMVGVTQGRVSQMLALLDLPKEIQEMLAFSTRDRRRPLTEAHTRVLRWLTSAEKQIELAREVFDKGLTVDELRIRVEAALRPDSATAHPRRGAARRTHWRIMENSRYRRTDSGLRIVVAGKTDEEVLRNLETLIAELRR